MARAQCRVCFCEDDITKMLAPCNCKGSIKYIHPGCLRQCIHFSNTTECGVCKTQYNLGNTEIRTPFLQYLYDILSKGTLVAYSMILSALLYDHWKVLILLNAVFAIIPAIVVAKKYYSEEDLEQKERLRDYLHQYWSTNIPNICHGYMFLLLMTILNIGFHAVVSVIMGDSGIILQSMQWINLSVHTFNVLYNGPYHYLKNIEFNDEFLFID